jgi:hypothetical protein
MFSGWLAQWLRSYFFGVGVGFRLVGGTSTQIGESWGNSRSSHPPNKERGNCAWGAKHKEIPYYSQKLASDCTMSGGVL